MTDKADQIEDLIVACAYAIDDDRLEQWPDFFVEDGSYVVTSHDSHARRLPVGIMTCTSKGMMHDRILALRKANIYEPHRYRHLISRSRMIEQEQDVHRVETNFAVIRIMQEGDMSLFACGRYLDEIVWQGGVPKFKSRTVVCDSGRIDTLIVIPL